MAELCISSLGYPGNDVLESSSGWQCQLRGLPKVFCDPQGYNNGQDVPQQADQPGFYRHSLGSPNPTAYNGYSVKLLLDMVSPLRALGLQC